MEDFGQSEVDELGVKVGVDHDVFRLDVPVRDVETVHVLHSADHLRKHLGRAVLRQRTVPIEVVKQFHSPDQLHEDVGVLLRPDFLVDFNNVGVLQPGVDVNLPFQVLDVLDGNLVQVDDLDRHFGFGVNFGRFVHVRESAFADQLVCR